ncbi:MAG TPA: VOC family protein [Acidimicrobiales bacterium]|nr:VOC family protein [Acidimicrobiales bacterium]
MSMPVPNVIPVLVYEDIEAGHDYLVKVFGFTSRELHRAPDGTVVHGEVSLGDHSIWLHAVTREHELDAPKNLPMSHGGLSVHLADVDAHFKASRDAGARIDREPTDQPYGLREYGARDPEGHRFWFATPI